MKKCTGCKQSMPATTEFFWRDKHEADGFRARCKACCSETPCMKRRRIFRAGWNAAVEECDSRPAHGGHR